MKPPSSLLRILLLISVAFFLCMGLAHFSGLKWPVLFVYFDTPYYAYQDKIISFTLITYASLFFAASRHLIVVPYALISIWGTVLGLSAVNLSSALSTVLENQGTLLYWLQTVSFAALAAVLTLLYLREKETAA
ncbi:hypothetical protein [Ruegeria arenilitoris]|uniref:hypothetical protein n=1 Tax=Ruegeria arenilitoris TaxID=1173585 RepID=UPI00147DBFDC|nr:hypothetical protein [Ruegeria arenilitoris]